MNNDHRSRWTFTGKRRGLTIAAVIAIVGLFFWGLCMAPSLTTASAAAKSRISDSIFSKPPATLSDEQLKVFAQALDVVEQHYAEPKTSKDLVYGAVQGAVGSLDPHSSFMTPEDFKELQVETKGKFSGIGIEITLKDRKLIVVSPIEGTPAYRAGIMAGDQIVKVDGTPTKNISITDAVKKIRGTKGSHVNITINRPGFTKPQDLLHRPGHHPHPQRQGPVDRRRLRFYQGVQFPGSDRPGFAQLPCEDAPAQSPHQGPGPRSAQ